MFPTVMLTLVPTEELCEADELYIGLNGFTATGVDNCITGYLDEEEVTVDLSEDDQIEIRKVLDEACKLAYGMDCEDLLNEAKKRM